MSITALRAASASHGRHEVFVSNHFPAFNIRRLWRVTGGYLRRVLDGLARRSRNRRLLCFFQVQTLDEPDFWQPRGTEVRAERRRVELSHSPLHAYADLMDGWGPRAQILVEQWELQGRLFWRLFAAAQKGRITPQTARIPRPRRQEAPSERQDAGKIKAGYL